MIKLKYEGQIYSNSRIIGQLINDKNIIKIKFKQKINFNLFLLLS